MLHFPAMRCNRCAIGLIGLGNLKIVVKSQSLHDSGPDTYVTEAVHLRVPAPVRQSRLEHSRTDSCTSQ
eukprot:COSAG01_NODE_32844_length_574_cov_1.195789_1_plen_68_part_10